jgi:hypothetical protein
MSDAPPLLSSLSSPVARRACGVHQPQAKPRLFFSRPCLTARQHTARLPAAEHSIDHLHGAAESPDPRRTIMTLTGHGMQERFEHVYLAAAAALAGITTFFRPLHIHWQLYHPPQPRGPAHLEVSSVAAQGWWVRVASKWICSSRSPVEGCDPGSSLGHAHPHGGATTSSASFNGRRGKPFPRARRHGCCSPCTCWPCACCVLTYE